MSADCSEQLRELLRDVGFKPEDFPEPLRINSNLLRYVKDLPREQRAEYLGAVRELFRIYERFDDKQQAELLELFESSLPQG